MDNTLNKDLFCCLTVWFDFCGMSGNALTLTQSTRTSRSSYLSTIFIHFQSAYFPSMAATRDVCFYESNRNHLRFLRTVLNASSLVWMQLCMLRRAFNVHLTELYKIKGHKALQRYESKHLATELNGITLKATTIRTATYIIFAGISF